MARNRSSPFISPSAFEKSSGSPNDTNPYPCIRAPHIGASDAAAADAQPDRGCCARFIMLWDAFARSRLRLAGAFVPHHLRLQRSAKFGTAARAPPLSGAWPACACAALRRVAQCQPAAALCRRQQSDPHAAWSGMAVTADGIRRKTKRALRNVGYFRNACESISSFTSLPRSLSDNANATSNTQHATCNMHRRKHVIAYRR